MSARYFSASVCYDPQEGGWTYYIAAAGQVEAGASLAKHAGIPERSTIWEEHRADEVVTVDSDATGDYDQIVLGTLRPGEVRCFSW